ncbi:MAG: dihydropteroate synthase [Phycisphaerales bacterium]|nr:MAG: dihydropteroate synthase [Phycisphaerales bacterium]
MSLAMEWTIARGRSISLKRPVVMGVVNLTPDSFLEASRVEVDEVARTAAAMVEAGADVLDLGAESTRPGSTPVPVETQLARVIPAIRAIRSLPDAHASAIPISVDTTHASVARAAFDAGADIINDTSAGRDDPAMLATAGELGMGLVLMHRLREPASDQYSDAYARAPRYARGVVECVREFLAERVAEARRAGVHDESLVVDPGLGFGKSVEDNLELMRATSELAAGSIPVMSALSRKSFVGRVSLGRDSEASERLSGTLAFSVLHLGFGAMIFRVHDVREHREALDAAISLLGTADASLTTGVPGPIGEW